MLGDDRGGSPPQQYHVRGERDRLALGDSLRARATTVCVALPQELVLADPIARGIDVDEAVGAELGDRLQVPARNGSLQGWLGCFHLDNRIASHSGYRRYKFVRRPLPIGH